MSRPYTRTTSPRVRFPGMRCFPETIDILRELQEKTGMSASLLTEMGLIALRDADLDYSTCPECGRWAFNDPNEWGHLKEAVEQATGRGDDDHCPHCGKELHPE